jgi:hypothetical protein
MNTKKAFELEVGDAIMFNKKYFVIDWIDPEYISDEISDLYDDKGEQYDIKAEHCYYTFFDDMILNFAAKSEQIIHRANYDDEFEYLGKVKYEDFEKGKYERMIKPKLRFEILKRDKHTCQSCGKGIKNGVTLHIDHIIPFSKGGRTEIENLQTLCDLCNYGKGSE